MNDSDAELARPSPLPRASARQAVDGMAQTADKRAGRQSLRRAVACVR